LQIEDGVQRIKREDITKHMVACYC
jgi:hypothetical protein